MSIDSDPQWLPIREHYDTMMSERMARKRELQAEMNAKLEAEEEEAKEKFVKHLHEAFNKGATKAVLRHASRQYGSPLFQDLWDSVPFENTRGSRTPVGGYTREGDIIVFNREGSWDWTGITADTLQYEVVFSTTANKFVPQSITVEHINFVTHNLTKIDEIING